MTATLTSTAGATDRLDPVVAHLRELFGDSAPTLTDLAADVDEERGASLASSSVLEGELRDSFDRMGIREPMSAMLADADANARDMALHADGTHPR